MSGTACIIRPAPTVTACQTIANVDCVNEQIVKLFYTAYHDKEAWLHLHKLIFCWRLWTWYRQKQVCIDMRTAPGRLVYKCDA